VEKHSRHFTVKNKHCMGVTYLYIEIVENGVEFFALGRYDMVVGAADLVRAWSCIVQRQFTIDDDGVAIHIVAVRVGATVPQSNRHLGDTFPVLDEVL